MPASSLNVSDETEVTNTSDPESTPRVAMGPDGNMNLIYGFNDGDEWELWYRKVDENATTLKGPIQFSPTDTVGTYGGFDLVVDATGRVHIVFSVAQEDDDVRDIFYAQVSSDGAVAVSAKRIYSSDVQSMAPDVDVDGTGNAYVVWNERTDPPAIHWMKLSPTGSVSRQDRVISGDLGILGGDFQTPKIGVSSNGDHYVIWRQQNSPQPGDSIYFTSQDSAGVVDVDPRELEYNGLGKTELEADLDSDDNLYYTYVEGTTVYYTIVGSNGNVRTGHASLAQSLLGEVMGSDLAIAPNDDVYFIYCLRANRISAPWNLYLRIRWESNNTISPIEQLNEGGAVVTNPSVAAGADYAGVIFIRDADLLLVTVGAVEPNRPPVADLVVTPSQAGVGETVTFDGSGSTDPDDDDEVDEYFFEWGDGGNSGWVTSTTRTHSYSSASTYTARLRVRDTNGLESEEAATATVRVTTEPPNEAPVARLSVNPSSILEGESVTLDGSASTDEDGTVDVYSFNFGDGTTSGWITSATTTHTYSTASTYFATLQVRDDEGKVSDNTDSATIIVEESNQAPTATIESITPDPAIVGEDITFTGSGQDADGTIEAYEWSSNLDQVLSTEATFTSNKVTIGVHTISFKVKDDDNEWSEPVTQQLEVKANSVPVLQDLTKDTKGNEDKVFEFVVTYKDSEGDVPTTARLYYEKNGDAKFEELRERDTNDKDYTNGKEYFYNSKYEPGTYTYWFEFRNSPNGVKTTTKKEFKVEEAGGFLPAPGVAAMALALLATAIICHTGRKRPQG
jgi:hypothetical protein